MLEFPAMKQWPKRKRFVPQLNPEYVAIEAKLKNQPANEIRVVAAGLGKTPAGSLRSWLNKRENVTARTTSDPEELANYTEELRDLGIDFTQLSAPNNHIVLARYSDADQA